MKKLLSVAGILLLVGCSEETVGEPKNTETSVSVEKTEDTDTLAVTEEGSPAEPIEVQPGNYTFGEEFKTGRYEISVLGEDEGTVYVKNEEGFVEVGEYFKTDTRYTFDADIFDTLETDVAILLEPAE